MTEDEVQIIFELCRGAAAKKGTEMPKMILNMDESIDLAKKGGGAIFINNRTFNFFKYLNSTPWIMGATISLTKEFFDRKLDMPSFAAIVHEMGHAYNVKTGIRNTEANAYASEVENLIKFSGTDLGLEFNYNDAELDKYLEDRLKQQFRISLYNGEKVEPGVNNLIRVLDNVPQDRFPLTVKTYTDYKKTLKKQTEIPSNVKRPGFFSQNRGGPVIENNATPDALQP